MEKSRQTQGLQVPGRLPTDPGAPSAPESQVKVAIALGYAPEAEDAPRVLAGGRGAVAEQILNIAFAQGIRVREDADLAQLLSALDIDSEIPVEAFAAVAEILAYVYRANRAAAAPGATTATATATSSGAACADDAAPDQPLLDQPLLDQPKAARPKGTAG
jgi:flagellar biosynthesis protein